MLSCIMHLSPKKYKCFFCFSSVCFLFAWKGKKRPPCPPRYRRSTSTYVELHRQPGENNSSRLFFSCTKQLNGSVCAHMYVHVYVSVPSCQLTYVSLCTRAGVIQKERYLIILCSPIQVIQMIWTLSIGADGHYGAYICNLIPFKCILEKRQSRLLNTFTLEGKLLR